MIMPDHSHDPEAQCWVEGADDHADFPIQNLPFGIFSTGALDPRIGVAIGDQIVDLRSLQQRGILSFADSAALASDRLNAIFAARPAHRLALRHALFDLLSETRHRDVITPHLYPQASCTMHLPAQIGDYTDFYVGIHHATNIGTQFRPDNPLLPNYKHIPIGYHGRASSVRVSGADCRRPWGQVKPPTADTPAFLPCKRLDYELEMGVWISGENALGHPVSIADAPDRIAGLCLLNDWSARDIQAWEYQPLGPFLAKNFLTTISPWVVTAEALMPFRLMQPQRPEGDPSPLPYLLHPQDQAQGAFAITLDVWIETAAMRTGGLPPYRLSRGPASNMYWTMAQMITHHGSNGCSLMPGDLLGTGTISGPDADSLGSMMEISRGGTAPLTLPSGETRCFLEDGDTICFSGRAEAAGYRSIGFGPCAGTIVAAVGTVSS